MEVQSSGSAVTLGVCSDTHFWFNGTNFEGESLQLQGHSQLLFDTLLAEIKDAKLDLLIHLGDMTCGGGSFHMPADDFQKTLQQASNGFQNLGIDAYALPGNHDCMVGDSWTHFGKIWSVERGAGKTIDLEYARLVLLNAQGHTNQQIEEARPADPVYGWVSNSELTRLEEALATANGRPVILFVHQLLKRWQSKQPWKTFYEVLNKDDVLALMVKYDNVRAVFQGHAHRFDVQTKELGTGECTFTVLPSLIEYPLGWLKLSITKEQLLVSLQTLPLERLSEQSKKSGNGQEWRCGQPEWHNFSIKLHR